MIAKKRFLSLAVAFSFLFTFTHQAHSGFWKIISGLKNTLNQKTPTQATGQTKTVKTIRVTERKELLQNDLDTREDLIEHLEFFGFVPYYKLKRNGMIKDLMELQPFVDDPIQDLRFSGDDIRAFLDQVKEAYATDQSRLSDLDYRVAFLNHFGNNDEWADDGIVAAALRFYDADHVDQIRMINQIFSHPSFQPSSLHDNLKSYLLDRWLAGVFNKKWDSVPMNKEALLKIHKEEVFWMKVDIFLKDYFLKQISHENSRLTMSGLLSKDPVLSVFQIASKESESFARSFSNVIAPFLLDFY